MKNTPARFAVTIFCCLVFVTTYLCAQEVRLQYKFKAGDISRYKETTQNDITSDMMPNGGQKVFNDMYTTLKVDTVIADGSAEIIQTIDSVNTLLNGQPFSNPQTQVLVGLPVKITMTATGKVLDAQPTGDTTNAAVKTAVGILRKQLMTQPSYPATILTLNVPWIDSTTFTQETQMGPITTNIKYLTKFTGVDTISNIAVKVLERTVGVTGDIGDRAGTLKGAGRGNILFSDILGKEIKSTMTLDESMDMVTPQGPFSMAMKISTKRELLK